MVICPIITPEIKVVDLLPEHGTNRDGGFGSTGK